ncbi:MAG: hypothetical protein M3299_07925 [Thermoproteota archaeon]|nr:hypothetical protein [Thermoproteota archaeon]
MLKTKEERLRLKESVDSEHGGLELAQTRCEEMVKCMSFEKLLYVAADDTWTGDGIEEKKQKLRNDPREELEKTAANRLILRVYASQQHLAQEPSWEEVQEARKRFYENDEIGRLCIRKTRCQCCYNIFYAVNPLAKYCHSDCKREAFIERRRKKKNFEGWLLTCRYCKEMFVSYRKDSKFCSSGHRTLACNARKRQDPELLHNEKTEFPRWLV